MANFKEEKIPQVIEGDEIRTVSMKDGTIRIFKNIVALQTHNTEHPDDRVRPIDPKSEK